MTTKRFATRDFNDAGTGRSFNAGDELTGLSAGELANYEHAGLAGDKPDAAATPAPTPAPGSTDKAPVKSA